MSPVTGAESAGSFASSSTTTAGADVEASAGAETAAATAETGAGTDGPTATGTDSSVTATCSVPAAAALGERAAGACRRTTRCVLGDAFSRVGEGGCRSSSNGERGGAMGVGASASSTRAADCRPTAARQRLRFERGSSADAAVMAWFSRTVSASRYMSARLNDEPAHPHKRA